MTWLKSAATEVTIPDLQTQIEEIYSYIEQAPVEKIFDLAGIVFGKSAVDLKSRYEGNTAAVIADVEKELEILPEETLQIIYDSLFKREAADENTVHCTKCGKDIGNTMKSYCPDCEKSLQKVTADEVATVPTETPVEEKTPAVEDMARRRIELEKKLQAISEELAKARQELEKDIADLKKQVDFEDPILRKALDGLPDAKAVVDGWVIRLKKKAGYSREKTGDILDAVELKAKEIAPKIAHLIAQLRGTAKYLTDVAPTESLEVKPEKKKESSLKTADMSMYWDRFKSWIKSVFKVLWSGLEDDINELEDLGAIYDSQEE